MCGVPAAKLLHVPGPDLGRTGGRAERSDQLLRLGYRTPEDLATAPEYPRAIGALEWGAAPAGWAAVKTLGAQATVNYARETGERFRPATSGGAARDAAMRVDYRDGKRGLLENTLCAPDANPLIPHTPGFLMRRAASSHANFSLGRPPTCLGGDYRVSTRLVSLRTAGAPPFRKMLPRRPVTADPRTGKPLSESADIVYNPRYPGVQHYGCSWARLGTRTPHWSILRAAHAPQACRVLAPGRALCATLRNPPPPRTKWTRRVPHPVQIGHAAYLTPY